MTHPHSHAEFLARRYFQELDGLRAVSIALVVTWHVSDGRDFGWLHGYHGVTIFFVLSGFLITTLLLREEQNTGSVSLRAFYIRRAFRILPLYYLVLAAYAAIVLLLHADPKRIESFTNALPYYALYFSEYPHFTSVSAPFDLSWSLGIEEKFYAVWPIVAFGLAVRSLRIPLVVISALVVISLPSAWAGTPFLHPYGHILVGCGAALLLHDAHSYRALTRLGSWQIPLAAALLIACMSVGDLLPARSDVGLAIVAGLLLMSLVVSKDGVVATLLRHPWPRHVGAISYGIYLTHQLCLNAIERVIPIHAGPWRAPALLVAGGGLAILVSAALATLFERPLIRAGRRIAERIAARRAAGDRRPTTGVTEPQRP